MTGTEVIERALSLLNYTDPRGRVDPRQTAELHGRCLPLLNMILADLLFIQRKPLVEMKSPTEELPLDDATALGVMPYGVAMLFAQSENDGDSQQLYAALYNQKRNTVTREIGRIKDSLPVPN